MIQGQLTIFDFLRSRSEIEALSIEEIAAIVGEALGVTFQKGKLRTDSEYYEAEIGRRIKITVDKSQYSPEINNSRWFCGADIQAGTSGAGAPCDTIEEAIKWFRKQITRFEKEGRK